jgi:prepilin-type N-terminal cleavage/methylation domain-containing protein
MVHCGMSARRRHASGFTLIELLVVLAIQGIVVSELLPAVQHVRQKLNQQVTDSRIREIASAEAIFRNADSDGDLLDDYGTLPELAAAGLVILDLADGQHAGYVYQVGLLSPPNQFFQVRARPANPKSGILSFYVDPSQIVRFSETAAVGPSSPTVTGPEACLLPETAPQFECRIEVGLAVKFAIGDLEGLVGTEHAAEAAALLDATPGLVASIIAAFDSNGDGETGHDELFAADLLDVAREVIVALDLGGGPSIGADDPLRAITSQLQNDLRSDFVLDIDAPQPLVPLSDLSTDPQPAIDFLLNELVLPVPVLGAVGAGILAGVLLLCGVTAPLRRQ